MELPLHDTELLYFISNPYGEFLQFVIARNDGKHKILARILAVGIKDIKTMGAEDLAVLHVSYGDVDYAYIEEENDLSILTIGGIDNYFTFDQINWEFTITAEKIFYEEKIIKDTNYSKGEYLSDYYLEDFFIGGKHIPKPGEWKEMKILENVDD